MYKWLILSLFALTYCGSPVPAQSVMEEPYEPYERSFTPPSNATSMGTINIQNGQENSWGDKSIESLTLRYNLETEWGTVVFEIDRTRNDLCATPCPDTWTVLSVPDGYVVRPENIIIPEGSYGTFEMFQFNGM